MTWFFKRGSPLKINRIALVLMLISGGVAGTPKKAHALDAAAFRAQFQSRQTELLAALEAQARQAPTGFPLANGLSFCQPKADDEAHVLWTQLLSTLGRGGLGRLVPALASQARRCSWNDGGLLNAGLTLEWMFWNGTLDLLGREVADGIGLYERFYELYSVNTALSLLVLSEDADSEHHERDFLDSPADDGGILSALGAAAHVLEPEKRRVLTGLSRALDRRQGTPIIFAQDGVDTLNDPESVLLMRRFYHYLLTVKGNPAQLAERHGGWHALMRLSGGDQRRVVRVLATLASLRLWPLEGVGAALANRGRLSPDQIDAIHSGIMSYFMITELDNRSALNGSDDHSLVYHFFYPEQFTTSNWKFYHWYTNAYLAQKLRGQGHSSSSVEYAVGLLARTYEFINLNRDAPTRRAMGVDPRVGPLLEGWDDVEINAAGGRFGLSLHPQRRMTGSEP